MRRLIFRVTVVARIAGDDWATDLLHRKWRRWRSFRWWRQRSRLTTLLTCSRHRFGLSWWRHWFCRQRWGLICRTVASGRPRGYGRRCWTITFDIRTRHFTALKFIFQRFANLLGKGCDSCGVFGFIAEFVFRFEFPLLLRDWTNEHSHRSWFRRIVNDPSSKRWITWFSWCRRRWRGDQVRALLLRLVSRVRKTWDDCDALWWRRCARFFVWPRCRCLSLVRLNDRLRELQLWMWRLQTVKPAKDLCTRRSWRIKHHSHDTDIVCPQAAHVPTLYRKIDKLLGRVDPSVNSAGVNHVVLIVPLSVENGLHGHCRAEYVPEPVRSQDEATIFQDAEINDVQVRIWANYENVVFGIVAPEIAEGTCNGKKRNFFDVRGSTNWTLMRMRGTIPENISEHFNFGKLAEAFHNIISALSEKIT